MKDDRLDLEPYRKAWQAEAGRWRQEPPRHTEEELLAMLDTHGGRHPRADRRRTALWGAVAAGVLLLAGVVWLLWLRTDVPATVPAYTARTMPVTQPAARSATAGQVALPPRGSSSAPPDRSVRPIPPLSLPDLWASLDNAWIPRPFAIAPVALDSMSEEVEQSWNTIISHAHDMERQALFETAVPRPADSLRIFEKTTLFSSAVGEINIKPGTDNRGGLLLQLFGGTCVAVGHARPALGLSLLEDADGREVPVKGYYHYGLLCLFDQPDNAFQASGSIGISYRVSGRFLLRADMGLYGSNAGGWDLGLIFDAGACYELRDFQFGCKYRKSLSFRSADVLDNGIFLTAGYRFD